MPDTVADFLPTPRGLLFDWDNTLVDSWPCITQAMHVTFTAMGQAPWTVDECKARVGKSMRDSFPVLFGDAWEEARSIFYDAFKAIHIDMLTPLPGAETLLAEMADRGMYLGIVSNKTGAFLRDEVEHLGWNRYFSRLVGAGDAPRDKPAIDPVLMALDGSGLAPGHDVWFVGDNLVDMQCGTDSGCPPILLHPEPPQGHAFPGCPPRLIFCGCEDFAAHLRNLPVFNSVQT